jgi:hypothetical protein
LAAVPCPPLPPAVEIRVHINDQHYRYKWKQLTLVDNLLFFFRVNEIPNNIFILDSHLPFICSEEFFCELE